MKKLLGMALLLVLSLSFSNVPAEACYGVRSMAMGGAFIAVADDVNTVYWNPAGLSNVRERQFAWQRAVKNRDSMNYIDVYELVVPLKKGWSAIGISYVNDRDLPVYGDGPDYAYEYKSNWTVLSFGTKLSRDFAVGVNVRSVQESAFDAEFPPRTQQRAGHIGIDLSFLGKSGKFSYGLLIQDANTPPTLGGGRMIRNTRPGIAYRPDDKTILAVDAYNLFPEEDDSTAWSFGLERKIGTHLRLRAGNYHQTWTYGLGIKVHKHLELNVAQLSGPNLGYTTLIGVQGSF